MTQSNSAFANILDKHALQPGLQWIVLDDDRDFSNYLHWWGRSRYQRPHDHPGFLNLIRPQNCVAVVALYTHSEAARIIYPFFQCDLSRFPPFREVGRGLNHLISPYGYGGALYEGDPAQRDAASAVFEYLLNKELRERAFVSEFVREDIFSDRLARRTTGELEERPNVAVRLQRTPEEIWQGYNHAVRGNIRRAQKEGLRTEFDPDGGQLNSFLNVYFDTMRRRNATEDFFIPAERFRDLNGSLGKLGRLLYVHVRDQDEVISSELLLLSQDTVYSFLGGSLAAAFSKRPNNLLKHEVILWGAQQGYKWLVLGGGLSANDELLRFKRSFDHDSLFSFRLRKIVHNQPAYDRLVAARIRFEEDIKSGWVPRPGFFPAYLS